MPRALRETLMSVGSVLILLSVLIAFDAGVRDQVSRRVLTHPAAEVVSVERQAHDLTNVIVAAAREQSRGHAPLLIFTLAASVLVVFMLRT
jgi:Na+-transporting methylmalonyl-CoA/oxaloacetate decarboxylase gamma subunit